QTQKGGSDVLAALSREFKVSADYLLGLTDIPDRKNYEIGALGLSDQAARNLYTGRVNTDVVNRLLEHPKFPLLTAMIAQYLDDTFAAGVAAQNELFDAMSDILLSTEQSDFRQRATIKEAARTVKISKTPPHQMELTKIQNTFMTILKEMKRDARSGLESAKAITSESVRQMMAELTKGQDVPLTAITPEQIVDAIVHTAGSAGLSEEGAVALRGGLLSAFESLPGSGDTGDS
ncbi:MAG: XRE family transcriptional regulator, partial [Dysosmobacter sp.]|nr:XRE family transcriptional regulator [Dysosmobacter sp.]